MPWGLTTQLQEKRHPERSEGSLHKDSSLSLRMTHFFLYQRAIAHSFKEFIQP